MKTLCANNYDATAKRLQAGSADYLERMNAHHANAKQLNDDATVRTDNEVMTCWKSPQALRNWAHENDLADIAFQSFQDCMHMANKARWKAYQHSCYVKACALTFSDKKLDWRMPMSLAEVTARYANAKRKQHDPPGLCLSSNVLATCHASNAPGLSPTAMTYWQVPPRE